MELQVLAGNTAYEFMNIWCYTFLNTGVRQATLDK